MKRIIVLFAFVVFLTGITGITFAASQSKGNEYAGPWVAVNSQNFLVGIIDITLTDANFLVRELSLAGKVKSETTGVLTSNGLLQVGPISYSYDSGKQTLIRNDGLSYRKSSQEEIDSIKQAFKKPTPDVNY